MNLIIKVTEISKSKTWFCYLDNPELYGEKKVNFHTRANITFKTFIYD